MIASTLDRIVNVVRRTSYVLDPTTAAASMAFTRQPVRESVLSVVVVGGTTGSGTVTVSGTVGGLATSEAVTFTANGSKRTAKAFTAGSGITTSGLADEATKPTVSIEALGADGTPQATTTTVATGVAASIRVRSEERDPTRGSGQDVQQPVTVELDWSSAYTPRPGDIVHETASGDRFIVRGVRTLPDPAQPDLFRLACDFYDEA